MLYFPVCAQSINVHYDRMRWLGGIIDSVDMSLSKLWEMVKDRKAWSAAVYGVDFATVAENRTRLRD